MMLPAIFGISGTILSTAEKEFLQKYNPHGIILFNRNCESCEQIIRLNQEIKSINSEIKIFIDQEGGRVARIKPPIAAKLFPNMESFGDLYRQDKAAAMKAVEQNFFELMSELKTLGIDVTCAPVCDLRYAGAHDVIGDRSFGADVQTVVDLASAALDGLHRAGGEGVIKHIPGHGRSMKDSHHALPVVDVSLEELRQTDFAIFKALASKCPYAMTAHIIYTCFDKENTVTTSKAAIEYIRDEIGFRGMIMTDSLDMHALSGTMREKTAASLSAGCDIMLQCSGDITEMLEVAQSINV